MMEFHIRAREDELMAKVFLKIFAKDDRKVYILKPIELEELQFDKSFDLPVADLVLDRREAQQLMNDLWGMGVRPSDIGSPGQLQAIQKHLEDMRRIAFGMLEQVGVK